MATAHDVLSETPLKIRVFGGFRYESGQGDLLTFKSKKAEAALLALVLESPAPVARDRLVDLLWSDLDDMRSKAGLRQALMVIRKAFGPDFVRSPTNGWLSLDRRHVWCDLWALKDAAAGTRSTPLIKGGFLDFAPRPTERFDEWLTGREHEIRTEVSTMLQAALEEADQGDDVAFAEALLELDPLHEEAALALYRHRVRDGRFRSAESFRTAFLARVAEECDPQDAAALSPRFDAQDGPERTLPAAPDDAQYPPTVSVTPLKNLSGEEAEAYFGQAFAEELLVGLSQQRWFKVCAVDMHADYKPPGVLVGRHDGPRTYRLAGSYALNGVGMKLRLKLSRATDGDVVWAAQFDNFQGDLFDIGDDIVRQVTSTVSTEVMSAEATLAVNDRRAEADLDDWTRIMKARHLFWRTSRANNALARSLLDPCLRSSPDSIPALTTAAFVRLLDVWSFWSRHPADDLLRAVELSQRAVRTAPRDPWAHFTLGTALGANKQLRDGVDSMDRALALQPSLVSAVGERGRLHVFLGDFDAAEHDAKTAVAMNSADPHLGLWLNTLGLTAFLRGAIEDASDWARRAVAANPYWFHNYLLAAAVRRAQGDMDGAIENFAIALKQAPNMNRRDFERSHPFDDPDVAQRYLEPLTELGLT